MKLYQPVKPFHVNQKFGENNACVDIETGTKVITADGNNPPAGYRSLYGKGGHGGVDLASYHGQPVYSSHEGKVVLIDTQPKSGLDVRVEFTEGGNTYRIIYEHLLGYQPKIGDMVEVGSLIGWADNTGWSSGDHLHLQLDQLVKGKWVHVDPMQFMVNKFALEVAPVLKKLKEVMAQYVDLLSDQLRK